MRFYWFIRFCWLWLLGSVVLAHADFCANIYHSWWKTREKYRKYNRERYSKEAREYCAQFNGMYRQCLDAPINIKYGAFVGCTIEGHGSDACVPSPCAFLNNGFCTPEMTGGLCQWFERIPDPDEPTVSIASRGCYRNPCHLSGQDENNKYYCTSAEFKKTLDLYRPRVRCGWCPHHKMGCQNVQTNVKSGCDVILKGWINNLARKNARNGKKVGSMMYIKISSNPDSPYQQNTPCWDRSRTFKFAGGKKQVECLYGIHPMCHPDLGYEWKYRIRGENQRNKRLLTHNESGKDEEYDVAWTLSRHGYYLDEPYERIQTIAENTD